MRGVSLRPAGRTLAILLPGTRKTCITKTYPEASASFWAGLDPRLREDDGKLRHSRLRQGIHMPNWPLDPVLIGVVAIYLVAIARDGKRQPARSPAGGPLLPVRRLAQAAAARRGGRPVAAGGVGLPGR